MEGSNTCTSCAECHDNKNCTCIHHKMLPGAVLLISLAFLLKALGVVTVSFVDVVWPVLLGLAMVMKLVSGNCKCFNHK